MRRFQANNCEGAMPARRATKDTLMPGCVASSTSRTFSAADHRRRRCTEVMTSNREIGPSEGVVIVVIIGLRLCLISYAECPVEKGGSSGPFQEAEDTCQPLAVHLSITAPCRP